MARSTAGWPAGLDWCTPDGSAGGYEGLLVEQYHYLLAAITGYLGIELTLDGLAANGLAPAGSERLGALPINFARRAAPA